MHLREEGNVIDLIWGLTKKHYESAEIKVSV